MYSNRLKAASTIPTSCRFSSQLCNTSDRGPIYVWMSITHIKRAYSSSVTSLCCLQYKFWYDRFQPLTPNTFLFSNFRLVKHLKAAIGCFIVGFITVISMRPPVDRNIPLDPCYPVVFSSIQMAFCMAWFKIFFTWSSHFVERRGWTAFAPGAPG